jgi:hypothetical protein
MTAYVLRYLVAATLARGADAAAPVGLVLLAVHAGAHGAGVGGLLAACLTAPHLLGPVVARRLDRARDGRRVLAAAFAAYGAALGAAALLLGRAPLVLSAAAVVAAGTCGPLLTGGLSSRLAAIPGADRRAEGWDAVSYGLGATAGPALVAALAAVASPLAALLAVAVAPVVAAAVTLTLPRAAAAPAAGDEAVPSVREVLRLVVTSGPLRRVGVTTLVAALASGGVPSVIAVVLGSSLGGHAAGAALAAAFGLGNLAGSLAVTAVPLRGEPELGALRCTAASGVALALCALAPGYGAALAAFGLAGAVNGPLLAATLAARSRHSPPSARAQVFVTMAGAKIGMASAGTALAGAAIGAGPRVLLAAGAAVTVGAAVVTAFDRRLERNGRSWTAVPSQAAPGRGR